MKMKSRKNKSPFTRQQLDFWEERKLKLYSKYPGLKKINLKPPDELQYVNLNNGLMDAENIIGMMRTYEHNLLVGCSEHILLFCDIIEIRISNLGFPVMLASHRLFKEPIIAAFGDEITMYNYTPFWKSKAKDPENWHLNWL